ncbi:MAG: tetratricopeptide repeat protein [Ktedonobacteraceae bacterium]|nr:tetratricopeptide repeat protein [Ktedonobacteraceae bacterium]
MTQALSAEEKARLKKQWTDLAIKQAQEGQWEEAVNTNKNLLNLFPMEPEIYNRLGKAYSELGMYTEARQAYSQTLKLNPNNTIARKNLDRLALLQETEAQVRNAERIDADLYIDETGKTGVTSLIELAAPSILAKVGVGDKVQLRVNGHRLLVISPSGDIIGQVEPRLANRLINFIEGGNRYAAAITYMGQGNERAVRIRIREVYQHPSMLGKVSFPSQGSGETIRAYIKGSVLSYDREEDDELGNEDEYYDGGEETEDISELDLDSTLESEE